MNIYLIGMMGSGKSTLGRLISRSLEMECIDLDTYIVENEGKSIPEIFASKGEPYFRERESYYLMELSNKENLIVATGGGAPCFANNINIMNNSGKTIFLDVPEDELFRRLFTQKKGRPLLENKTDEELKQFISSTMDKRRSHYEKASIIIKGKNISPTEILDELNNQVQG